MCCIRAWIHVFHANMHEQSTPFLAYDSVIFSPLWYVCIVNAFYIVYLNNLSKTEIVLWLNNFCFNLNLTFVFSYFHYNYDRWQFFSWFNPVNHEITVLIFKRTPLKVTRFFIGEVYRVCYGIFCTAIKISREACI